MILLFSLELLLFSISAAGLGAAVATRRSRIVGAIVAALSALPLFTLMGIAAMCGMTGYFMGLNPAAAWITGIAFLVAFVTTIVIEYTATRRTPAGLRKGAGWPLRELAAGSIFLLALLLMTFWNLSLQSQLEVQALRIQLGTLALNIVPPQIAEADNAAPLYTQAAAAQKSANVPADNDADYATLSPTSPQVTDYLQRQQQAIDLFRRAADKPSCRLDHDYFRPDMETLLPQLSPLRAGANLLALAAQSEAAHGSADLALGDAARLYRMVDHAANSPLLVSALLSIAIDTTASRTLGHVLPAATTPSQLDHLAPLDLEAPNLTFAHALRGEEIFGLATFCDFANGDFPNQLHTPTRLLNSIAWPLWISEDVSIYRDILHHLQNLAPKPFFETAHEREALLQQFGSGQRRGFLSAIVMPSFEKPFQLFAEAHALRECAIVAIAATRYRLEHHEYPDRSPIPLPLDPFDGQRLRYHKNADGSLTIYSVGKDLKDDGGQVEAIDHKRAPDTGIKLGVPPSGGSSAH